MATAVQSLIECIRRRNYGKLRGLIEQPGILAARSIGGRTALHAAAEEGDSEATRILLAAGADSNARMQDGKTPLHTAAHGYCGAGCGLLAEPDESEPPLGRPIGHEVAKAIRAVLKQHGLQLSYDFTDPSVDLAHSPAGAVFFDLKNRLGSPGAILKELLGTGLDIDRAHPIFADLLRGKENLLQVTRLLLDQCADINAVDEAGETALDYAVQYATCEMVELLLDRGASLNAGAGREEPNAQLRLALEHSRTDIADVLARHGARVPEGNVVHDAAFNGQKEVMLWLLDHGIDVDELDANENTPLLKAAVNGQHENVLALLARGADPTLRNWQGDGLLHCAAHWSECLERVLALGFPLEEKNAKGRTPLHTAAQFGTWRSINILLRAGVSPDVQDKDGNTPLHTIFESEEFRPDVEFPDFLALVDGGAARSIKNRAGKTAADLAAGYGYPEEFVKLLDPRRDHKPSSFIWLGVEPYSDLLPKAAFPIHLDGQIWPSCENLFYAKKAVAGANWSPKRDGVMRMALKAKFAQHEKLRTTLLGTGEAILISDANCDSYWREQLAPEFNAIGRMIMSIREELKRVSAEGLMIEGTVIKR